MGEKKGCLTWGCLGGGGGASERPGGLGRLNQPAGPPGGTSAGRHGRRAEPPEPNRPSRTAAEGTACSFRPAAMMGWLSPPPSTESPHRENYVHPHPGPQFVGNRRTQITATIVRLLHDMSQSTQAK